MSLVPLLALLFFAAPVASPVSADTRPASPRLAALAAEIAAAMPGDSGAVDRFWLEAAGTGTPLVEPVEKDGESVFVTFLYRGGEDVRNVVVIVNRGMWGDIDENAMERLPGTDVWHRTYKMRRDARFAYQLSVNDPLTSVRELRTIEDWMTRSAGWRLDPLNPRRFPQYPSPLSVVELPDAPPQPWVAERPGVPRGQVAARKIKSLILGNERTVWVYSPPGPAAGGADTSPPGLLIIFDGGSYTGWVPTPTILDNLLAEGRIPPLLAAFVSHPLGARDSELCCSDPFTRFLAEELVPWLRRDFGVASDPERTIIGGSSYGGLGAAYAAFRHPEIFGRVLSQSGGFMYSPAGEPEPEWLIRQIEASPKLPVRFHLDCGLMEDRPTADGEPSILATNRHMRDALLAKGYRVHYLEVNGGHEYLSWRGTLADGLIALLGK